ncbi:MAG: cupredoxin domain-containing protein [Nitrosopumilus sp.]
MLAYTMNTTRFMGISTAILSITLMALFVQPSIDFSQDAFAAKKSMENDSARMITQTLTQDNVSLEFSVPETIMAGKLVPVNAKVTDSDRNAHLSHTDWSYAIIGPDGEIVHKTTTLHGHFGVMNFKDSFPEAGTYTIKYTVLSSGPFMLGDPVPELGQTRAVVSGDLLKFAEDPTNDFGSRSFEFTVNVGNQGKTITLEGSEPDTEISVTLSTQPERIVVGQPTTLLLDVNDAKTGEDATHVDGLLSINRGYFHYPSTSGDQPDAPIPIPLNGAYHGHRGVLSTTHTFSQPGTYMIKADLNVVPYSVPLFGETSTVFTIQVHDNGEIQSKQQSQPAKKNTVDIVGLESPFYLPNEIRASAGETIIFDNIDGNQHTVTSVKTGTTEPDGKFDSGLLQPGEKFELTLKEKGTYHYYCALHPGMQGTIIVS